MIRSTNLTALQTAVDAPALPQTTLVAKIGRPGDSVSLNPQPLPPMEVFANVKAAVNPSLSLSVRSNVTLPFGQSITAPVTQTPLLVASLGGPHHRAVVPPAVKKAVDEADQLAKAENLMQDAYRKLSNPARNAVDYYRAEEEVDEAGQIRRSVLPGLSDYQQKALSSLNDTEQDGIGNAEWGVFDVTYGDAPPDTPSVQKGYQELEKSKQEFQLGAQENQSLINWILS